MTGAALPPSGLTPKTPHQHPQASGPQALSSVCVITSPACLHLLPPLSPALQMREVAVAGVSGFTSFGRTWLSLLLYPLDALQLSPLPVLLLARGGPRMKAPLTPWLPCDVSGERGLFI